MALVVRAIPPDPQESIGSFAYRLAACSSHSSPTQLLSSFGITAVANLFSASGAAALVQNLPADYAYIADMAYIGRVPGKAVMQGATISRWHLDLTHPKVCFQCVAEGSPLLQVWDLRLWVACPKHHRILIDQCPYCNTPLAWNRDEVDRCHGCDANLRRSLGSVAPPGVLRFLTTLAHSLPSAAKEPISGLPFAELSSLSFTECLDICWNLGQIQLQHEGGDVSVWPGKLETLRLVDGFSRIMGRLNGLKSAVQAWRKNPEFYLSVAAGKLRSIEDALEKAFGSQIDLLNGVKRAEDQTKRKWSEYISLCEASKISGIGYWSIKNFVPVVDFKRGDRASIKAILREDLTTLLDVKARREGSGWISRQEAKEILGAISQNAVTRLAEAGLYGFQHSQRSWQFNAHDIRNVMNILKSSSVDCPEATGHLKSIPQLGLSLAGKWPTILAAVSEKRLPLYHDRAGSKGLGAYLLNPRDVEEFRKSEMPGEWISMHEAGDQLRCSYWEIKRLLACGLLVAGADPNRVASGRIRRSSVEEFVERWMTSQQVSEFLDCSKKSLCSVLSVACIEPKWRHTFNRSTNAVWDRQQIEDFKAGKRDVRDKEQDDCSAVSNQQRQERFFSVSEASKISGVRYDAVVKHVPIFEGWTSSGRRVKVIERDDLETLMDVSAKQGQAPPGWCYRAEAISLIGPVSTNALSRLGEAGLYGMKREKGHLLFNKNEITAVLGVLRQHCIPLSVSKKELVNIPKIGLSLRGKWQEVIAAISRGAIPVYHDITKQFSLASFWFEKRDVPRIVKTEAVSEFMSLCKAASASGIGYWSIAKYVPVFRQMKDNGQTFRCIRTADLKLLLETKMHLDKSDWCIETEVKLLLGPLSLNQLIRFGKCGLYRLRHEERHWEFNRSDIVELLDTLEKNRIRFAKQPDRFVSIANLATTFSGHWTTILEEIPRSGVLVYRDTQHPLILSSYFVDAQALHDIVDDVSGLAAQ